MDSPEHERRWVEDYLRSQSGPDFAVEHVEKLTSEYVMGRQHDVWDAHTNEGRWWVITNPTNLYSQDAIKSMDIALSFHVGLMTRMMAGRSTMSGDGEWVLGVLRRIDVAYDSLDRAKEVEDFQAVGMRLREALLTLGERLAALGVVDDALDSPKRGDFKAWAALTAGALAAGSEGEHLRGLLRAMSEKTWGYVNWLTHARRARESDARLACGMTAQVVEAFAMAVNRWRLGEPERCPTCGSYRLVLDSIEDEWLKICSACGHVDAAPPHSDVDVSDEDDKGDDECPVPPPGACIEIEDFGIYLTPSQAAALIEAAGERLQADEAAWSNPFAVADGEGGLADAHRLAYREVRGDPNPGSELVYDCGTDACVNPGHATEESLRDSGWSAAVVERVVAHPKHLQLSIAYGDAVTASVFVDREILDRHGVEDASALIERVVFLSLPDQGGWRDLVPAARRVGYGSRSVSRCWVHPGANIDGRSACPCGSGEEYAACRGALATET